MQSHLQRNCSNIPAAGNKDKENSKGWIWFAAQELDKLEQHLQSCHEPCLHHQAQNLRQDYAARAGSNSLSVLVPVKRPAPSNYLVYVEPGWKEEKF